MRIALFDQYRIGIVDGAAVRDVTDVVDSRWHGTPYVINELIEHFDELQAPLRAALASAEELPLADVTLLPPVPRPGQLLAAPANYHAHVTEMSTSQYRPTNAQALQSPREVGFFVKSSGSISGPSDAIELPPMPGRAFHHEVELGIVIGKPARGVPAERVADHIFGYVILLDLTLRTEGERQEERTMRKSFETFTPIGPFIVTADEVPDPGDLDLKLWVNGELRQQANTRDLIVGIGELIEQASNVVTLRPGDIYATGTPEGVGPIEVGDVVRAEIDGLGELSLPVVKRGW
ncbi:2-keto-4-pentenoate hydratase/2-oxohepta-3-ene-1,7-dioic acid hydratase (catechol pathway) [Sinosporangium album]|uniref:2-keto-4-pentenoate hydratase/2-oxohepta-3-ene-1,7-dioic acid hydratase (Catechol pathway) n=1 Tax=Sinosporangium album TaxID=504805 RepID=A0A1G7YQD6_9ACTN|nr:fumarylacetoacetate hydrolase family protein [Sinosporangium album]SDG98496.1 2-keto-4-pentenoate hydratase/2-oxohepta-3-ene-1,7-dioic acid hydratase (catechol pathway) [Sinosporangium album]